MIASTRERARRLAAELEILLTYDARRAGWYDYGAGQRAKELSRRRRELHSLDPLGELEPPTPQEALEAFERVGRPRLRRLERESFRHGSRSTDRSVAAWRKTQANVEQRAARFAA